MKGIVFTELFEFIEKNYSSEFLQDVINEAELANNGVFVATGTYNPCEVGKIVATLARKTEHEVPELLISFGKYLFSTFSNSYARLMKGTDSVLTFLASIESHIHVEVLKLYPDAELPHFKVIKHSDVKLTLRYESSRHMGDLCEGLILGSLDYFAEKFVLTRNTITTSPISIIDFTLEKQENNASK